MRRTSVRLAARHQPCEREQFRRLIQGAMRYDGPRSARVTENACACGASVRPEAGWAACRPASPIGFPLDVATGGIPNTAPWSPSPAALFPCATFPAGVRGQVFACWRANPASGSWPTRLWTW